MENDDNIPKEIKIKNDYHEKVENVYKEILNKYKEMVDKINPEAEYFKSLEAIINKHTDKKFDVQGTANLFKEKLFAHIEDDFRKMWDACQMESNIANLELAKLETAKFGGKNWRPAHLPAEEQVRNHIVIHLLKQRKSLLKILADQENQIAELIANNEHAREVFKAQMKKRARILEQINVDKARIQEAHSKIDLVIEETENQVKIHDN